jgi:monoamine oxidase
MSLTRRALLERLGAAGGFSAAYLGMEAMGLLARPAAAEPFELPPAPSGKKVVILGAGIAGLVAAYEMRKTGWDVTVLEARDRIGGRVWTLRGGDRVVQTGRPDQLCAFSDGLYMNAGAARIPTWHHNILGYARKLGVPIEVMVNSNRAAKWDFAGQVVENRQAMNDVRGMIAGLLAKAIGKGGLDQELSKEDKEAMAGFLAFYGELNDKGEYEPQGRSGYTTLPGGYAETGRTVAPLRMQDLMKQRGWGLPLMFEEFFDQQSPMFQPVGGMDRIAHALYRQVKPAVRLKSPVLEIRRDGEGVRIVHGPGRQALNADYCICTLGVNLLARIPNDFSPEKQAAMKDVFYLPSVKVGFESRRFWEDEGIYGGLGWTDSLNENLLYPSGGWHGDKGVLVAAYTAGWVAPDNPQKFMAMSHEERFRLCRDSVERLHPGQSRSLRNPVTVAWGLTPWSEGVGPVGQDWGEKRPARYAELLKPEGPIFFAGEHLSYVLYWQEGAALSSHEAMKALQARVQEQALAGRAARAAAG